MVRNIKETGYAKKNIYSVMDRVQTCKVYLVYYSLDSFIQGVSNILKKNNNTWLFNGNGIFYP